MKQIKEIYLIVLAFLAYLLMTQGDVNSSVGILEIVQILGRICRIAIAIYGMILITNHIGVEVHNRAKFLAISSLAVGLLVSFELAIVLGITPTNIRIENGIRCRWVAEYMQIITLGIALRYVENYQQSKLPYVALGWIIFTSAIVLIMPIIFPNWIVTSEALEIAKRAVIAIGLTLFIWQSVLGKIIHMSSGERIKLNSLFILKIALLLFYLLPIQGFFEILIEYALLISYDLVIVNYISDMTVGVAWKKIAIGMESKREEIIKGKWDQQTLIAGAKEIKRGIRWINQTIIGLEEATEGQGETTDYLLKIRSSSERLDKLSEDLLDLHNDNSVYINPQFEVVNLSSFLEEVVKNIEPYTIKKQIEIEYITSSAAIMATVDKQAIERMITNLISNAIKYNKYKGKVQVILTERKQKIFICVKDTGIGIPSQYLEVIFKKFQRVNSKKSKAEEGSGLGLFIVKSLVELHHGEIKIVSREGIGTLISIGLPVAQEADNLAYDWENQMEEYLIGEK